METIKIKWKCQINTVKETMLLISLSVDSTQPRKKISELEDRSNESIKKKIGRKKKKPTKKTIIHNLWNKSNGPTYM